MKLFTGSLAAGLVLLAARRAGAGAGALRDGRSPYTAASDFGAPYAAVAAGSAPQCARAALRLRPEPAAVDGSLRRAARQRLLAARHPAAARLRLHDRGDRPRRRRTAGWSSTPATAGSSASCRPTGCGDNFDEEHERSSTGPSRLSRRRPRRRGRRADQVQAAAARRHGRAQVASRAVPMPKAKPARRQAAPRRRRSSRRQRLRRSRPRCRQRRRRRRPPAAAPAKPAPQIAPTAGHADGAGAGVRS